MIELENNTHYIPKLQQLLTITKSLTKKNIELIITDSTIIQQINRDFRAINKPTDVLSFPSTSFKNAPLGTIIINIDLVHSVAKELNHHEDDEFALLFIHGLLHLLGYDHEKDRGEMRAKEKMIIEKFNLPTSLICRTLL